MLFYPLCLGGTTEATEYHGVIFYRRLTQIILYLLYLL